MNLIACEFAQEILFLCQLFKAGPKWKKKQVRSYLINWIRYPNPQGQFAQKTKWVSWLPDWLLIPLMKWLAYDGMIFINRGKIISHIFFQQHGTELHMFSVANETNPNQPGLATQSVIQFIDYAWGLPHIKRIRIGKGNNPAVARIYTKIQTGEIHLPFNIELLGDGWIQFHLPKHR